MIGVVQADTSHSLLNVDQLLVELLGDADAVAELQHPPSPAAVILHPTIQPPYFHRLILPSIHRSTS